MFTSIMGYHIIEIIKKNKKFLKMLLFYCYTFLRYLLFCTIINYFLNLYPEIGYDSRYI